MTPGGIEPLFDDRFPEKRSRIGSDDGLPTIKSETGHKAKKRKPLYSLRVIQQPERARLCSFKEENETIDRRPVDPPPVVELLLDNAPSTEPESGLTKFFIRASIVHPQPADSDSSTSPTYTPVKTPTGADASAGEVVQTPERLRGLEGEVGQLVIFAKLSVRMPGLFRLKFTLFQTSDSGLMEITHTISDTFEVFSPKLFKGMRESTALTRHLAAQGLKVKLRTDTSVGRQSEARRRGSAQSLAMSPQPLYRPHTDPPPLMTYAPVPVHATSMGVPPPSAVPQPHSAPPRSLVWREHESYGRRPSNSGMMPYSPGPSHSSGLSISHAHSHPHPHPYSSTTQHPHMNGHAPSHPHAHHPHPYASAQPSPASSSHSHSPMQASHHVSQPPARRPYYGDDGLTPNLFHPAPSLRWTPDHPSDLAAFSLNQNSHASPVSHPAPAGSSSISSHPSSRPFSPYSTQPSSMPSRTSSERSDTVPTIDSLHIRGRDDGFSLLPIFPTQPSVSNLLSDSPPSASPRHPGPSQGSQEGSQDMRLPPMGRPDRRDER